VISGGELTSSDQRAKISRYDKCGRSYRPLSWALASTPGVPVSTESPYHVGTSSFIWPGDGLTLLLRRLGIEELDKWKDFTSAVIVPKNAPQAEALSRLVRATFGTESTFNHFEPP
jgi:hypothetical protein